VTTVEADPVPPRRWHAQLAWLARPGAGSPGGAGAGALLAQDVLIEARGARFTAVTPGTPAASVPPGTVRLAGLTLPGLANAHSHAFHRALRGAASGGDTFWTWRERMYAVAERLDPERYFALARAVYAEMALAGITCVGEFHYLHHAPAGRRYRDPNELGRGLIAAAAAAGVRITLLDACYLAAGFAPGGTPLPLAGVQLRFGDGSAAGWAERVSGFGSDSLGMVAPHARLGAAVHSVRAVGPDQVPEIMAWSPPTARPCTRTCRSSHWRTPSAWPPSAARPPRSSTPRGRSAPARRWYTPRT
jgi:formiminoglutamate deiminase